MEQGASFYCGRVGVMWVLLNGWVSILVMLLYCTSGDGDGDDCGDDCEGRWQVSFTVVFWCFKVCLCFLQSLFESVLFCEFCCCRVGPR